MDPAILNDLFPAPEVLKDLDPKGQLNDEVRNTVMRKLRVKSENRSCFECSTRNPTWCSVTFGVYLCLECSGEHRRKGVHISYVRSVDMDKFYPNQLVRMACGGNGQALAHFKECGMGKAGGSGRRMDYTSKQAAKYKEKLDKAVEATCATLGIDASAETIDAASSVVPGSPVLSAAAAPAQQEVKCPFKVDQRVQFRDKGNPTWKWGFVTHTKPLKIDYALHDEVRETISAPVLDAAAQKSVCFGTPGAAPKAASTPSAPSSAKAPSSAAPKSNTTVIRRGTSTASAGGYASGAAPPVAALPEKKAVAEVDFAQFDDKPEVSAPSPDAKSAPTERKVSSPEAKPSEPPAVVAPQQPKKEAEQLDFDFDF